MGNLLTGKNRKKFNMWYIGYYPTEYKKDPLNVGIGRSVTEAFHRLPIEMQIGVLLAYYDSIGISIYGKRVIGEGLSSDYLCRIIDYQKETAEVFYSDDLLGAYKEALIEANKNINE